MLTVVVAFFCISLLALLSSLYALLTTRVPVVRTPRQFLEEIAAALALKPGEVVVDAGCGDARTLLSLCRKPEVHGRGYELNGPVWLAGWLRCRFSPNGSLIRLHWQNFFRCELEDVDLVYCHLMPGVMGRVGEKCKEEMRPHSRLASYLWEVPGWNPSRVLMLGARQDPLYIYEIASAPPAAGPQSQDLEPGDCGSKT